MGIPPLGGGELSSLDGDACQVIPALSKYFVEACWIITEVAGSKEVKVS